MNTLVSRLNHATGASVLIAMISLACALPITPAAAAEVNVSGTWKSIYHCEVGWCAGQNFPAEATLVQAPGSSHVQAGSDSGTLNGNVLTLEGNSAGYSYKESVTISADGKSWSGPLTDSHGTSGTDTATRVSGGPEEGPKKEEPTKKEEPAPAGGAHKTGMTVLCNYDVLTSQDTCTATVADTSASPTPPSGKVTFASPGGGLFAFGNVCSLASSPSAPSTASCSVQYLPPTGGGFPSISADYAGDATHATSGAKTQFILAGGSPTSYDTSSPVNGGYPNEVSVEIQTPVRGTQVTASVTKGETGTAHPVPGKTLRASEDPSIVPSMRTEVEERDREQRYPDIVPSMRKEVEEREIEYEADVARIHREVNEAKRHPGGLSTSSQEQENALVTGDTTVLAQIKQQENSPALKGDPASQATLAKMTKQAEELQKLIGEILKLQREATGRSVGAINSSVASALTAVAAKARPKLVTVGYARRVSASSTIKLRIPLKRSTLARLTRGKRSITLNLRVSVVIPSALVKGGIPLSTIRQVKLSKAPARKHKH
ncbi:MAG TPA: hypothetical protein VGO29_00420 [Solirubrobacteraceae bacterium]|jgi:hypothetical protein|nr:hypothetical protein [Solirubrobacteraceae bacterium]